MSGMTISLIYMYYDIILQAVTMSPLREKGVSKKGYLTKAPFHGENNGTPGAKVKFASCLGGGGVGGGVLTYISYM